MVMGESFEGKVSREEEIVLVKIWVHFLQMFSPRSQAMLNIREALAPSYLMALLLNAPHSETTPESSRVVMNELHISTTQK